MEIKSALEGAISNVTDACSTITGRTRSAGARKVSDPQIDVAGTTRRAPAARWGAKSWARAAADSLWSLSAAGQKPAVRQALSDQGLREMPFDFDFEGSESAGEFLSGLGLSSRQLTRPLPRRDRGDRRTIDRQRHREARTGRRRCPAATAASSFLASGAAPGHASHAVNDFRKIARHRSLRADRQRLGAHGAHQ